MSLNKRKRVSVIIALSACAMIWQAWPSQAQRQNQAVDGTKLAARRDLINDYCVSCHSQKNKTAGVSLEHLDFNHITSETEVWERMLRKMRTGQMPPASAPKPDKAENQEFVAWLESTLDQAAQTHPNPGRPAIHRLNRAEYSNAIRDLLAVDIKPGQWLPVDDSGYGFDNIGEVLTLSPALLEKYLIAARRVSRLAVGDRQLKPAEERYQPRRTNRTERASDDLPFFSRGGLSVEHYFPLDGEYQFRVRTPSNGETGEPARYFEHRMFVKAGLRKLGAAYPGESAKPEPGLPNARRGGPTGPNTDTATTALDLRIDGAKVARFEIPPTTTIELLIVNGPFNVAGRGVTASRAAIFTCRPNAAADEENCAQQILSKLAKRAFRRLVTNSDVEPLLSFYRAGRQTGDFDEGIQRAIEAMLVSPDFLFRVESDPGQAAAGTLYQLNDFELASRLSFFLWSSIPDEELLTLAEQGKLKAAATLQQQVKRLLEDPRSSSFVNNFGGQWLQLRNLETMKPDPDVFPNYDLSLQLAFRRETELFFDSIVRDNRPVFALLDADYTFLNQRLAEHYGIKGVYGSQFRRVTLDQKQRSMRGGLLGQGSLLTVTSYPNRTSVVQRGKWILENLLGSPPPPPPPDVPDLKPKGKDGKLLTMREQLDMHRANAICASCHSRMDPIGFALENYDGIGKWRTKDAGSVIDVSGKLPDGTTFNGPAEFKKILLTQHREEFVSTVIEKLLTYALGRGIEAYDAPAIRAIMRETAADEYRLPAIINAITKSKPFLMRRTPTA